MTDGEHPEGQEQAADAEQTRGQGSSVQEVPVHVTQETAAGEAAATLEDQISVDFASPTTATGVAAGRAGRRSLEPFGGMHPHVAAERVTRQHSVRLHLPMVGTVHLPATTELAFLGGVGALAVIGAIEWPVAVAVAAGHALAANHRNKVVEEFGEALETA